MHGNSRDLAARCWQRGSTTTVPTCAGHLRIVPVSVFRVETKNTVFMTYPMHNWAPYWLFTMVHACVPHFNLWRVHKHPCSFQLRIALNLKSTRRYMGIDLVPYVKSRTSAQHNCKIWEAFLADCWLFRCILLNIDDRCIRWQRFHGNYIVLKMCVFQNNMRFVKFCAAG